MVNLERKMLCTSLAGPSAASEGSSQIVLHIHQHRSFTNVKLLQRTPVGPHDHVSGRQHRKDVGPPGLRNPLADRIPTVHVYSSKRIDMRRSMHS